MSIEWRPDEKRLPEVAKEINLSSSQRGSNRWSLKKVATDVCLYGGMGFLAGLAIGYLPYSIQLISYGMIWTTGSIGALAGLVVLGYRYLKAERPI